MKEQDGYETANCYDCRNDPGNLTHTGPYEAIEDWLDDHLSPGMTREQALAVLPETATVNAYERRKVDATETQSQAEHALEGILERLDEEYGGGDEYTEQSATMKAVALAFAQAVIAEYHVWQCEPCGSREVNVAEWLKENPDFLADCK